MSLLDTNDQASFLQPRDPSILYPYQRPRMASPVKKQLFSEIIEEEQKDDYSIKSYLRLKPSARNGPHESSHFSILDENTIVTKPSKDTATKSHPAGRAIHQYTFTKVFGPEVQQKDVFEECVTSQMRNFIRGNNCLLFAYGTTNAGKTFTIQGSGEQPGIIPRALDMLFKSIQGRISTVGRFKPEKADSVVELDRSSINLEAEYKHRILQWNWDKPLEPLKQSSVLSNSHESDFISTTFREMQKTLDETALELNSTEDVAYGVWISFAEIYNECVYDLLEPMSRGRKRLPLKVAQEDGHVFVKDLRSIYVTSGDEAFHVMLYGKANLQIASTNMNARSSRSHCIFTIRLVRYFNSDRPMYAHVSSFSFCDLAGAERAKKTLNVGDRLKESNNINSSLHVLGRCIMVIRENQGRREKKPIPFRDSKLTRLFQRAFSGHCLISMIVNVTCSPILYEETVNVLKFSAVAKQIIFEPPITFKKPRDEKKKSRFSVMVLQPKNSGPICWDSVSDNDENASQNIHPDVHKWNKNNEQLLNLVDVLKDQLQEERKKNVALEREIREELANNFSKIMAEMDNTYKTRIQDMEERNVKVNTWRINQLEQYYKEKLEGSRKRLRESDDDYQQSNENKIKELEEEVCLLKSKCNAIQQLLTDSKEEHSSVLAENSKLKFNLSVLKSELENHRRALNASQQEVHGEDGLLISELKEQLYKESKKLVEEQEKNNIMRNTLEEAKDDYLTLNTEREELETELGKVQHLLLTKDCELLEWKNNVEAAQILIQQKTQELDELEERLEKTQECQLSAKIMEDVHQKLCALTVSDSDFNTGMNGKDGSQTDNSSNDVLHNVQAQLQVIEDKLQSNVLLVTEQEQLKNQIEVLSSQLIKEETENKLLAEQLDSSKMELTKCQEEMRCAAKSHEKETMDLTARIRDLERQSNDTISTIQNQVSILHSELKESGDRIAKLLYDKENSVSSTVRLEQEVKDLQKEIKSLLQSNTSLKKELDSSDEKITLLEQELKAALQKPVSQPGSRSLQNDSDSLSLMSRGYEGSLADVLRGEMQRYSEETNRLREENEQLRDQLKNKDSEMESFVNNRTLLISRYEEALKKLQEEAELHKREACQATKALYKSTPTPNKNDPLEVRRLKEAGSGVKTEKTLLPENKRQTRSVKKGLDFSNENSIDQHLSVSIKEDEPSMSRSTSKIRPGSTVSSTQPKTVEKPLRRPRRLYARNPQTDIDSEEFNDIEVEKTCKTSPESFIKQLRSRKVL